MELTGSKGEPGDKITWNSSYAYTLLANLVLSAANVLAQPELHAFYKDCKESANGRENEALGRLYTCCCLASEMLRGTDLNRDILNKISQNEWNNFCKSAANANLEIWINHEMEMDIDDFIDLAVKAKDEARKAELMLHAMYILHTAWDLPYKDYKDY